MDDTSTGPPPKGPDSTPPEENNELANLSEALTASEDVKVEQTSIHVEAEYEDDDEEQSEEDVAATDSPAIVNAVSDNDRGYRVYQEESRSSSGGNPLLLGLTIALVFIMGLALGFFGRPVILEDIPIEVVVTVVPNETQAVAQTNSQPQNSGGENGANTDTSTAADTAPDGGHDDAMAGQPTPTIMDFVMSDARHILGEEAAPVTIIEFSDFN